MKTSIITAVFLLGSIATRAQQHDCTTAPKIIKESEGTRKVKNETAIVCYSQDAFDLVSASTGQILFGVESFDSYINPDGYKEEFISSRETNTEIKGWYQVNIIHGPIKEIRVRVGKSGTTYIVQAKNENFVQYEKPVYGTEEPKKDLSANARVTYNLDSFVVARMMWGGYDKDPVDCYIDANLYVGSDGRVHADASTVKGDCYPKDNLGFMGRVKQALNESWFIPAKDKAGDRMSQFYETRLHIKSPGGSTTAGTGTTNGTQTKNAEVEAVKKEAINQAEKAAKDGARKLLKGLR